MSATYAPTYPPADADARAALLKWVRQTPLAYGPWRPFKTLFKQLEAEPKPDEEILAALLARLDQAPLRTQLTGSPRLKLGDLQQIQQARLIGDTLVAVGSIRSWGSAHRIETFRLAPDNPLVAEKMASKDQTFGAQHLAITPSRVLHVEQHGRQRDELQETRFPGEFLGAGDEPAPTLPTGIAVMGDSAFQVLTSQRGSAKPGVLIYRLSDTTPLRELGHIVRENVARVQTVPERGLMVVEVGGSGFRWGGLPTRGGLHLYDISSPAQPRELDKTDLPSGGWTMVGDLLVTLNSDTLTLHRLENGRFREAGNWKHPGQNRNPYRAPTLTLIGALDSTVFVGLQYENGVHQLDVSDPANPKIVGLLNCYFNVRIVGRRGDLLYTREEYGGVSVWDMSSPRKPARLGTPPSPETLGYLKRRVRRLLHRIGTNDPAQYTRVTSALLAEAGRDAGTLSLAAQWPSVDALYGGTDRYVQMSHGRGTYVLNRRLARRLEIRRRDEQFPGAWDAHPEQAAKLLAAPDAVTDAYTLAIRVLRANRLPLPAVTETKVIGKMLASATPLLQAVGARSATALARDGKRLPGEMAALAFLFATPSDRITIARSLESGGGGSKWNKQFASALLAQVMQAWQRADGNVRLLRRVLPGVALLAERFSDAMDADQVLPLVPALLIARRPDFTALVARLARGTSLNLLYRWINELSVVGVTDADREPVLVALEAAVQTMQSPQVLISTVISDVLTNLHPLAWRLLASSNAGQEQISALWRLLLDRPTLTPALESAMASGYALRLLATANLPADEIATRLQARPFLAPLLSEETFQQLVETAPTSSLLTLAGSLNDEPFARLRAVWLRQLDAGVGAGAVWAALPDALKSDENGQIAARILGSTDFIYALIRLTEDQFDLVLAVYEPLMDDLVTAWAERHPDVFKRDSEPLTQAATSPLSRFRAWGLVRVQRQGLDLPVALRLMESDLPDALVVGRGFFETITDAKDAHDFALALADSPARLVRRYAREFMTARWDTLPRTDLYTALFENPDPEIRGWVATLLGDEPAPDQGGIDTAPFDRDVLRSRDTARPAKEKIKARIVRTGTVDTETLLSLARGTGTPRDAEWALSQLARRALAGEKIDGFSVDGVAG